MATRHREVESKFEAAEDTAMPMPDLGEVKDVAQVDGPLAEELEATYFDTSDLALAAAGITLRRRTGGDDTGWHLKIPAPDGSRDELRIPLGRAVKTVPRALREAVQLYGRGQELIPIALVRTRRSEYRLCDAAGRALVTVCDDGVTAQALAPADSGLMSAWREWEVELVDGKRRHLQAASRLLEHAGARPAVKGSKLARALGDRLPQPAEADEEPLRRQGPAATLVLARLDQQVAELKYRDPLVRHDAPDSVHKMRVAMRRLRSALASFRPLLDRAKTEPVREELKWIAGVLGEARDTEVLHQRLNALIAQEPVELVIGPVKQRLDDDLRATYRTAHQRSVEAMRSQRYYALVDALDALVADPPWTPRAAETVDEVLPRRVRRDYQRMRRRVVAADEATDAATRNERLHEVRKAAKRARYAAETLVPVYGRPANRFAKAAKRVQSILGDQHDAVVTQPQLRQLGVQAHLDGENAFTYGRLHGLEQARATELEAKHEKAWSKASRKKLRRWLS